MSDMIQLEIEKNELRALDRALKQLPWRVAGTLTSNATRSGASIIRKHARRYAPKRSGRLRKAIKTKRTFRARFAVQYSIGIDTSAHYYGQTIELGGRYKVEGGGTRFQPAKPFLRRGLQTGGREAVRKVGDMLWKGIRREAARLRR